MQSEHETKPSKTIYILVGLLVLVLAYNQLQIAALAAFTPAVPSTTSAAPSAASLNALAQAIIPRGVPTIYGSELKVSYDEPVASLPILANLDNQITLSALGTDGTARYIKITRQISCEYCCGVDAIVAPNGQAACGCQHSYAMRGVAKYLIKNHNSEYTDEQILDELSKWKTLFFPKQILTKALAFQAAGKDINLVDLASNRFRDFKAPVTTDLSNIPDQVGGC